MLLSCKYLGYFFKRVVPKPVPVVDGGNAHKVLGRETEGLLLNVPQSVTRNTLVLSPVYQLVLTTSGDDTECPAEAG